MHCWGCIAAYLPLGGLFKISASAPCAPPIWVRLRVAVLCTVSTYLLSVMTCCVILVGPERVDKLLEACQQAFLRWRRFKDKLEAIYTRHEERQKERVHAIKSQAGQSSMAERVKQVR